MSGGSIIGAHYYLEVRKRLNEKPAVHSLMQLGQTSYIGALETRLTAADKELGMFAGTIRG